MLGQNKTSGFCCYTDGCRSLVRIINVYEDNPWKIESHVRHFKEFGLKCTCLGPVMGNLHDRDSIALHQLGYIGAGVAGVAGIATIIKKIIKK